MAVKTYSMSAQSLQLVSPHFRVREFACPDGSDRVLIDTDLTAILERLRSCCKRYAINSIRVGSGYRTMRYNARIGGARNSSHLYGKAADIDVVKGDGVLDPLLVACTLQALGCRAIGCYQYDNGQSWIHAGSIDGRYWRQDAPGNQVYIDTFLPVLRDGSKGDFVKVLQAQLIRLGWLNTTATGTFAEKTESALKSWQRAAGLVVDGICGPKSWAAILTGKEVHK